jgi:hypothetical protein
VYLAAGYSAKAENVKSLIPEQGIERFIVERFDIRSIRSSLNPRRGTEQSHFADVGLRAPAISPGRIIFETPDWTYVVEVLKVGDLNNDGLTDIAICFSEQSHAGTYRARSPYLLTRYSNEGPLIAIAFQVYDKRCEKTP